MDRSFCAIMVRSKENKNAKAEAEETNLSVSQSHRKIGP